MPESGTTRERITAIAGGQIVPVSHAPTLTSASTPWSGFLIESHGAHAVRQVASWGWHRTHVTLFTSGRLPFKVRQGQSEENFVARAGSICVIPSGFDETRFSYGEVDFQAICVELDPTCVGDLLEEPYPDTSAIVPQLVVTDANLGGLLNRMMAEVKEGCPSGAIYAQSLSMALAAYLAGRFSLTTKEKKRQQFSEAQSRLLLDYIQSQLNHDLNLLDLAKLVRLCPRQFVRLFSNTFGTTPHRYIVNKRVALAKALLARGLLIFEVMDATGFTSQSHFTNVFRKVTGTSPGRFRQEHRPRC